MWTHNHIHTTSPYALLRYSQHNVNEGDCLCAAHIQLLSGMLKAATWWTAEEPGSRGCEAWSGIYSGEWGKIDFDAEAERVRCSGSMLNYLQTGRVTGDEQIKPHTNTHTDTHSGCTHRVWCESQRRFDIFGLGNNIDEYSLFAAVLL